MDYTHNLSGDMLSLAMRGKFTFTDHEKFRSIIDLIRNSPLKTVAFDFAGVDFIDSAALGMLLIAREEAAKKSINLILANPNGQIAKMFKVSKFDSLFTLR